MTEIPQPPGWPYLGNLFEIDPKYTIKSLRRLREIYGPIYRLCIVGINRVAVGNVELFGELCDERRFVKSVSGPLSQMRNLAHDGLVTAHPNENNWDIAHRIILPAFGHSHIQDMYHEIYDIASQLILKWARQGSSKPINVQEDATRFTLDAVTLCSMGVRLNSFLSEEKPLFAKAMDGFMRESNYRATRPAFLNRLMWRSQAQYDRDVGFIRQFAKELLDDRRRHPTDKKDILNAMINGRDPETGQAMSEESIINNIIVFVIAGHETTSGGISFLLYYLVKNPDIWQKVREEVDEVIGQGRVTASHLSKLRYVTACVREAMRLWPTIPVIAFKPIDQHNPTIIGEGQYTLMPKQTIMAILPAIHRDPEVWGEDAEDFRPERMTDDKFNMLPPNAWRPFGNGKRSCIGRPFAWTEMILITALIAQNFDLELHDPDYEIEVDQIVSLRMDNFFVHAKLRQGVDSVELASRLFRDKSTKGGAERKTTQVDREELKPIAILYGSNTGTCESLARLFGRDAAQRGLNPSIMPLNSAVEKVPTDQPVVLMAASYEGEPASNAAEFVSWLQKIKTPTLSGVHYAVIGCGHREWAATFHRIPKLIDRLMGEAGAQRLVNIELADMSEMTLPETFENWAANLAWPAIQAKYLIPDPGAPVKDACKMTVELSDPLDRKASDEGFFEGTILENTLLTGPGAKAKRHIKITLPSDVKYAVGDYLYAMPANPTITVQKAMRFFKITASAHMKVTGGLSTVFPIGQSVSIQEALSRYVELCQPATPKDLQAILESVTDSTEKQHLRSLSAANLTNNRISIVDLLEQAPSTQLSFSDFLAMLQPLRTRQYSISSSPLAQPSSCSLTVSIVDSQVPTEPSKRILGVSTHYLSGLETGQRILCAIRPSNPNFEFPTDPEKTPMVMVCAGSGIAPFRGFLQERACRAKTGDKLAPALLFMGCRTPDGDKLYGSELQKLEEDGIVTLRFAYSRLQCGKRTHVQDALWDERGALVQMYERGARFYLCGPSGLRNSALEVVEKIFRETAQSKGEVKTNDEYQNWLRRMNRERFAVDIFA